MGIKEKDELTNQVELKKVTLTKKLLAIIPEDERVLFFLLGHFSNEIVILHKLLIYSLAKPESNDVHEKEARTSQSLFIARLYIGKLFEGWQILNKSYFNKLSKEFDSKLSKQGKTALENLKRYFGKRTIVEKVRNTFSFHYDSEEVKKQYQRFDADKELTLYIADTANSFYHMSDEIINRAIFELIGESTAQKSLECLFGEVKEVGQWFIEFTGHCIVAILDKYFKNGFDKLQWEVITINNPPKIDEISIPFFVKK